MSRIRSCALFLVYSNLLMSVSAAVPPLLTSLLLRYPVAWPLPLVSFSEALLIYTFNRFTDISEDTINLPGRVAFIRRFGTLILAASAILVLCSVAMVALHSVPAGIIALLPLGIAVSYSGFRFKKFFLVKNILISAAWSCSVLIVGTYFQEFPAGLFLLAALMSGAGFVNTIIFDVKDRKGDALCNIRTIPVRYGFRATKCCCLILMIPLFPAMFFLMTGNLQSIILLPFLAYIVSYIVLLPDSEHYPWWYFGLYVDGEYVLLLGLILLFFMAGIFRS